MYKNIQLCVKTQNKITNTFASHTGIRQGDNLSPTLFNLFINDVPQYISKQGQTDPVSIGDAHINCLMYADDVVLLSTSKTGLQKCINGIKQFSNEWKLDLNLNKTKVLIFNKTGEHLTEQFNYGTEKIQCSQNYTYLGLDFDASGNLRNMVKKLYEKSLKALYKLYKLTEQNYNIKTLLHIFDHTIAPILLYGSELWGLEFAKLGKTNTHSFNLEKHLEGNPLTTLELKFY